MLISEQIKPENQVGRVYKLVAKGLFSGMSKVDLGLSPSDLKCEHSHRHSVSSPTPLPLLEPPGSIIQKKKIVE